jgi:hypothetical protein
MTEPALTLGQLRDALAAVDLPDDTVLLGAGPDPVMLPPWWVVTRVSPQEREVHLNLRIATAKDTVHEE